MSGRETPQLKLYDSLTKKAGVVEPRTAGELSVYICGPTVYNFVHVGNARPVLGRSGAAALRDAPARLARPPRRQHHRRRRQDLSARARGGSRLARARGALRAGLPRGHRPARARAAGRRAARDRDDAADRRADRGARAARARLRGRAATSTSASPRSTATASSRASASRTWWPVRASSPARPRSRRPTSRSGRARSPTRTSPGPRPGARAAPAGTSSARRWHASISATASTCTAAGSTWSSPTTRTSGRRARGQAPIRSPAAGCTTGCCGWPTRRCRSRSATSSGCATRSIASGARRCSRSSREPATACRSTTTSARSSRRPRSPSASVRRCGTRGATRGRPRGRRRGHRDGGQGCGESPSTRRSPTTSTRPRRWPSCTGSRAS